MRRNILITGASSGLGEGMARIFASRGHHLALCARRTERLEKLKAELEAEHPDIVVAVRALDVNDHAQVFAVFRALAEELGGLDRVVVNAGLGKGAQIGGGNFEANRQTVQTNFVGALAQCEAAMGIFRAAGDGHLVVVASIQAVRGFPGTMSAYAASKAGVAALAEGIRCDVIGTPIKVTTLLPGYIRSEMTAGVRGAPFMVDTETGSRALVDAIDKEVATAAVPWQWRFVGPVLKRVPLSVLRRMV
ncbi:MAG: SDR family oxidoreductase [Actinomycetota bacterium]|nr:SDR family oxidoreductase [Actinomycetota bacterium]